MVLACVPSLVLLFWTQSSTGRSCPDFLAYGGFCVLSWPQYRSSLHSVRSSRVWVTSLAWQIPDVYFWVFHEPVSDFRVCVCALTPVKNCSFIRDLGSQLPSSPIAFLPPPEKMFVFQVLHLLQTLLHFILSIPRVLTNLVPFLYGMQSSLSFCSPFSL